MSSPEKNNYNPNKEYSPDTFKEEREKLNELREQLEREKKGPEADIESIQHDALKEARSSEHEKQVEQAREATLERKHTGPISKTKRDESFRETMNEVQTHMSPASRTFSKVIHNKTVEKVSDAAGNTIARPNAILSGAIAAFVLTLAVYLVAKNLGYPLSGFESIGAFAVGWLLGLTYDFVKVMITGRK